jgi:hypothetical protein
MNGLFERAARFIDVLQCLTLRTLRGRATYLLRYITMSLVDQIGSETKAARPVQPGIYRWMIFRACDVLHERLLNVAHGPIDLPGRPGF